MSPDALTAADASFVRALVHRRAAIVVDDTKDYLINTRLWQIAREAGYESTVALVGAAQRGSAVAVNQIVEAITTHETSFFRDLHPFEALRKNVLPALLRAHRTVTIWSAACSSGQEPYSIAMLLLEHFGSGDRAAVKIVGTDISDKILTRAREGVFRQLEVNRGLPAQLLVKYFERTGADWRLKPEVRSLVRFEQLNLLDAPVSFSPDVVLLRNVLIYFDDATKRAILGRLRRLLPRDGALFLGGAETTINLDPNWARVGSGSFTYYQPL